MIRDSPMAILTAIDFSILGFEILSYKIVDNIFKLLKYLHHSNFIQIISETRIVKHQNVPTYNKYFFQILYIYFD